MNIPEREGKIILSFNWKGPTMWSGKSSNEALNLHAVELQFKNSAKKVSIDIPQQTSSMTLKQLPFKYWKLYQNKEADLLKVSIDEIRNLKILAAIFEPSPVKGPAMIDKIGNITYAERLLRTDREIECEIPENFEAGKKYHLAITSDDFSFSARLIKEEQPIARSEDETKKIKVKISNEF